MVLLFVNDWGSWREKSFFDYFDISCYILFSRLGHAWTSKRCRICTCSSNVHIQIGADLNLFLQFAYAVGVVGFGINLHTCLRIQTIFTDFSFFTFGKGNENVVFATMVKLNRSRIGSRLSVGWLSITVPVLSFNTMYRYTTTMYSTIARSDPYFRWFAHCSLPWR